MSESKTRMDRMEPLVKTAYQQLGTSRYPSFLAPEVVDAINAEADRHGVSRAAVLRQALTEYASKLRKGKK